MAHLRPIDKEFEEADDTGVLILSSRNLRNFPLVPGELCDFNDLLEAGNVVISYMYYLCTCVCVYNVSCSDCYIQYTMDLLV